MSILKRKFKFGVVLVSLFGMIFSPNFLLAKSQGRSFKQRQIKQKKSYEFKKYILTSRQLKKLSPKRRAAYMYFLFYFTQVVESGLNKSAGKNKKYKSAEVNSNLINAEKYFLIFLNELKIPSAHAGLSKLIINFASVYKPRIG